MLQAGAADVELRLAAGRTAGRAVEVDSSAAGRAASVELDQLQAQQQKV